VPPPQASAGAPAPAIPQAVERAVASHFDDPRAALAAAFGVFLSAAVDDPLIKAIVSGEGGDGLLALVTTHGGPVLQRATERLAAFLAVGWPQVPLSEAQVLAECVVRLAISHAALPSGPADLTAAAVARVLGPYVDRLLTEASDGAPSLRRRRVARQHDKRRRQQSLRSERAHERRGLWGDDAGPGRMHVQLASQVGQCRSHQCRATPEVDELPTGKDLPRGQRDGSLISQVQRGCHDVRRRRYVIDRADDCEVRQRRKQSAMYLAVAVEMRGRWHQAQACTPGRDVDDPNPQKMGGRRRLQESFPDRFQHV
jgi:hypothetical protein